MCCHPCADQQERWCEATSGAAHAGVACFVGSGLASSASRRALGDPLRPTSAASDPPDPSLHRAPNTRVPPDKHWCHSFPTSGYPSGSCLACSWWPSHVSHPQLPELLRAGTGHAKLETRRSVPCVAACATRSRTLLPLPYERAFPGSPVAFAEVPRAKVRRLINVPGQERVFLCSSSCAA